MSGLEDKSVGGTLRKLVRFGSTEEQSVGGSTWLDSSIQRATSRRALGAVRDFIFTPQKRSSYKDQVEDDKLKVLERIGSEGGEILWQCAASELRSDRAVVLAAVQNSGLMLRHASDKLKADRHVVLAAMDENDLAIRYAENAALVRRLKSSLWWYRIVQLGAVILCCLAVSCLNYLYWLIWPQTIASGVVNVSTTANGTELFREPF